MSATGPDVASWLEGVPVAEVHDPLTSVGKRPWLVICSCGWGRECSSEWAGKSVSKLHRQLGPMHVEIITRTDGPEDSGGDNSR